MAFTSSGSSIFILWSMFFISLWGSNGFAAKANWSSTFFVDCLKSGLVALTFDDGPSLNGGTEQILNVLQEKGVKATFFITGTVPEPVGLDNGTFLDSDEAKQKLVRRMFNEGHQIGSHTWNHFNLTHNLTKKQIHQEVSQLAKTVRNILGINMTILRPPHSSFNDAIENQIQQEFGYNLILANLITGDWYFEEDIASSFKAYKVEMDQASPKNRSFIALHHDPRPRSAELARMAIDYVRSKGFRLVTVGECIGVPDYIKQT